MNVYILLVDGVQMQMELYPDELQMLLTDDNITIMEVSRCTD